MRHAGAVPVLWLGATVAGTACEGQPIELDPGFSARALLCEGVDCSAPPHCPDGGNGCLSCACCGCLEGQTRCDPDRPGVLWRCVDGCFIDEPCAAFERCEPVASWAAECRAAANDCSDVGLSELISICGETGDLCAACGPCLTCNDAGVQSFCHDMLPNGDPGVVLSCGSSACFERSQCNDGVACVMGMETGIAACADEVDCERIGCTGFPLCDAPESSCGPCGCCQTSSGMPDMCGRESDGARQARYFFDDTRLCYVASACAAGEICVYDNYDRPICIVYP